MTEGEKAVIKAFACGDKTKREEAIAIHRENLRKYGSMPRDPFENFMSEIDNPCPDLALRAKYRKQVKDARVFFFSDVVGSLAPLTASDAGVHPSCIGKSEE